MRKNQCSLLLIEGGVYKQLSSNLKKTIFDRMNDFSIGIVCSSADFHCFKNESKKYKLISMEFFVSEFAWRSFQSVDQKMLIATDQLLISAALEKGFQILRTYDRGLPCVRAMQNLHQNILDKKTELSSRNKKLKLVISLDVDWTLIDFDQSFLRKKICFQEAFITALFDFLKQYSSDPQIKIKSIQLLTARDETNELILTAKNKTSKQEDRLLITVADVREALCELYKEKYSSEETDVFKKLFKQEKIPIFFTMEKYGKLCELYGKEKHTFVVHFDDGYGYLEQFSNIEHIMGVIVCGRDFFYERDLMKLQSWIDQAQTQAQTLQPEMSPNFFRVRRFHGEPKCTKPQSEKVVQDAVDGTLLCC